MRRPSGCLRNGGPGTSIGSPESLNNRESVTTLESLPNELLARISSFVVALDPSLDAHEVYIFVAQVLCQMNLLK